LRFCNTAAQARQRLQGRFGSGHGTDQQGDAKHQHDDGNALPEFQPFMRICR